MSGLLERLRELEAQTTPAPWEALDAEGDERNVVPWVGVTREDGQIEAVADEVDVRAAPLIAEVRNALPLLLDVAEAAARLVHEVEWAELGASGPPEFLAAALARLDRGASQ